MGGGVSSKFDGVGGWGLSQYNGGGGGWNARGGQGKGKYLVNICTVAFKLKKVIFLLN